MRDKLVKHTVTITSDDVDELVTQLRQLFALTDLLRRRFSSRTWVQSDMQLLATVVSWMVDDILITLDRLNAEDLPF